MPNGHDIEEKRKLIAIMQEVIMRDNELRKKYEIGEKFRFVRDKLRLLLEQLERSMPAGMADQKTQKEFAADEVPVYVYLYNAQGLQFRTWQNLVTPKVFYEYSVNRPVYGEKQHIESLLRSKTNKTQHAYLTIAVNKNNIIKGEKKDSIDNPVIKVKEGSLLYENVISFTHNGEDFILDKDKLLVRKP